MKRTDAFVREMKDEFPDFEILPKKDSRLQRAIHTALAIVTLGGQRSYATRYHTVMFGKLWVPPSWDDMKDDDRYILLRHERVHLQQRKAMGDVWMGFMYLVWIFPIGLAYGRARIEWEAYIETIRATHELYGLERAMELKGEILRRFTGPDYGWMWPFPKQIHRWFDEAISTLDR
jgi:hypothetical protein